MPTHAATTTSLAATHSHNLVALVAVTVAVLVIVTVGYLAACWLFPFTRCRHHRPRRAWCCRRCDGTHMRLRVGRHLLNRLRTAYRAVRHANQRANDRAHRHH